MSVWVPSQTISVITTTGKSALRRKRFTNSLSAGYQRLLSPTMTWAGQLRDRFWIQHGDIRQIPVPLVEVEPVADHELVGDLEARVAHPHIDLAACRLRQQCADLERGRVAGLQVAD